MDLVPGQSRWEFKILILGQSKILESISTAIIPGDKYGVFRFLTKITENKLSEIKLRRKVQWQQQNKHDSHHY